MIIVNGENINIEINNGIDLTVSGNVTEMEISQPEINIVVNGAKGNDGLSAYQAALNNGFVGTESQWLLSLEGQDGDDGEDGLSAYQIAVNNGFVGTEVQWLDSLNGQDGNDGIDGEDGIIPFIGVPVTARHYPIIGYPFYGTLTTLAFAANRIDLAPALIQRNMTPLGIGAVVTAFQAGSEFKILIYDSNSNGWPNNLVWSSEGLLANANTYRESITSMPTLLKGQIYWIGFFSVGTATMRRTPLASSFLIGGIGVTPTNTTFGTVLRRTVTYPTPPATWNFTASEITLAVVPPFVLFRF